LKSWGHCVEMAHAPAFVFPAVQLLAVERL